MGFAYTAKVAATVDPQEPDDWPWEWDYPDEPWVDFDFDPVDGPTWNPTYEWPPGWPKAKPANFTLSVSAPASFDLRATATVSATVLDGGVDTDDLDHHLIGLCAATSTRQVQLSKDGVTYQDVIWYKVSNYSGTLYGFTDEVYADLDIGDNGETLTWYAAVVTVTAPLEGTDTSVLTACSIAATVAGVATVSASLVSVVPMAVTIAGVATVAGTMGTFLYPIEGSTIWKETPGGYLKDATLVEAGYVDLTGPPTDTYRGYVTFTILAGTPTGSSATLLIPAGTGFGPDATIVNIYLANTEIYPIVAGVDDWNAAKTLVATTTVGAIVGGTTVTLSDPSLLRAGENNTFILMLDNETVYGGVVVYTELAFKLTIIP